MPVLAMVKLKGDPESLLEAKRRFMDPVAKPAFQRHGHRWQVVARDEEGLLIFNLWNDPDGRDRANADPAMEEARRQIVEATGAQPEFANWVVIDHQMTG